MFFQIFVLFLTVNSYYETWSEEVRGVWAGHNISRGNYELRRIRSIQKHPERRSPLLAYLNSRAKQIEKDLKFFYSICEK